MERLLAEGKCRAIGVSNYERKHLEELVEWQAAGLISHLPTVNQVELHPLLSQTLLRDYCGQLGVVVQVISLKAIVCPK